MALGCGSHSYTITDAEGGQVAASGDLVHVEWNRILNDYSSAAVRIAVSGPDCCNSLGNVRSWRHRLNIFRRGALVWSGFVYGVDWKLGEVDVRAIDLVGLLDRRVPHSDMVFSDTDLSDIATALVTDALAPDDPGHTVTVLAPALVRGGRVYQTAVGQTGDHLRDLSDTGIDFTAVGTNLIILPDGWADVVGRLSDDDLPGGLTVSEDGSTLATRQIVAGRDDTATEEQDLIGIAGGVNAFYGLLETYTEQTTITTQLGVDDAARARQQASSVVPVFIDTQDITLAPTAPVDVATLVPGWCVVITTSQTCRNISQQLKITAMSVTEDGGTAGAPGSEKITLQVAAVGNTLPTTAVT